MNRKLIAVGLSLALTLTGAPALAASAVDAFPSLNTYPGYPTCPPAAGLSPAPKSAMRPASSPARTGALSPTAPLAVSEAAAIAARMDRDSGRRRRPLRQPCRFPLVHRRGGLPEGPGPRTTRWCSPCCPSPIRPSPGWASSSCCPPPLPEDQLPAVNTITALPDTADADVLRFYNAGILTGVNEYGMFAGQHPDPQRGRRHGGPCGPGRPAGVLHPHL